MSAKRRNSRRKRREEAAAAAAAAGGQADEGPAAMTAEVQAELRQVFDFFDRDSNGSIDQRELGAVVRAIGHNPSDAQVASLIAQCDFGGDGSIQFDEFCRVMTLQLNSPSGSDPREIVESFRIFDRERTGLIHADTLREVLATRGEPLEEAELELLLAACDVDHDGYIAYEKFVYMVDGKADHLLAGGA